MSRLERIATNLNRLCGGEPVPDGFMRGQEIVPLTEVYEDLEINRLLLGETYYSIFRKLAGVALALSNARSADVRASCIAQHAELQRELRTLADADFAISTTSLHATPSEQLLKHLR